MIFVVERVVLKRTGCLLCESCLGRGGELGDGLGAFGDGVLGEFSGEHEADGRLDLAGGEGGLLRVARELGGFERDAFEDVVDEGVHDGHALLGDARVGVDLLEDAVDVGGVGLDAGLLSLAFSGLLGRFGGFLGRSLGHLVTCGSRSVLCLLCVGCLLVVCKRRNPVKL